MNRNLLVTLLAVAVAAVSAWWASGTELLGARPVWSPAPADYPSIPEAPAGVAGSGAVRAPSPDANSVLDAKSEGSPEAGAPGGEEVPGSAPAAPLGKEPAAKPAEPGSDPRFPPASGPAGLDPFLRSASIGYRIEPGDTLSKIARRYAVPAQLLANMNGIESERILAGAGLQVVRGPFHVLVLRDRHVLRMYCGGVFVKEYGIATGKPGHETPLGEFKVATKLVNPAWTHPETRVTVPFGEPENPLGTRWIGFTEGLGIHGTWDNDSIGKFASSGCVRMRNEDVEELYDFLVIGDSVVKIVANLPAEPEKADLPKENGSPEKQVASHLK